MSIAVDPKGQRPFVTPADRELPEDQQTEWLLGDLTERQRVGFMDAVRLVDDGSGGTALGGQGSRVYAALKGGLRGYSEAKPLRDARGEVVPFKKNEQGQVSDEFLARMAWADKVAIADEIAESVALSEADAEK